MIIYRIMHSLINTGPADHLTYIYANLYEKLVCLRMHR
jgi:hypothetical protein